MVEDSEAPAEASGWGNLLWIAFPTLFFTIRAGLWWRDWSKGKIAPGSMTVWDWFQPVFYHVAAIGGLLLVAAMARERLRASRA